MFEVKTKIGMLGFELDEDSLCRVELRPNPKELRRPGTPVARRIARELKELAEGSSGEFPTPMVFSSPSDFHMNVMIACLRIPAGKTMTYGELARKAGKPNAARAVGRVMATNPLPIVIPCHRVVDGRGRLHGYGGGLEMKQALLAREGVVVENGRVKSAKPRNTGRHGRR